MDTYFDQIYDLLRKKEECVNEIFEITKDAVFMGNNGEIEPYEQYLIKRQPYFDKLDKIVDQIKNIKSLLKKDKSMINSSNNKTEQNINKLEKSINTTINSIIDIDKLNNANMEGLLNSIKKELKNISEGKKINSSYLPTSVMTVSSFDSKK